MIRTVWLCLSAFFIFIGFPLYGAYDPGDFVNSAKRSYSIIEDFSKRWDKIYENNVTSKIERLYDQAEKKSEKELSYQEFFLEQDSKSLTDPDRIAFYEYFYDFNRGKFIFFFDAYFSQETISNLALKSQFGIINMDYKRRVLGFTLKTLGLESEAEWVPGVAFSAYGTWQGFIKDDIPLYGNSQIVNGNPEDNSFSDFFFNQVFDDFYVLSFYLKPIGYLHAGLLVNYESDPVDGIFGNGNDVVKKSSKRLVVQGNLFNFFSNALQYNTESEKAELFISKIDLASIFVIFNPILSRQILPDFYLGFQAVQTFSKELKLSGLNEIPAQYTFFVELEYYYYKLFFVKSRMDWFLGHANQKEAGYLVKQAYIEAGTNFSWFSYAAFPAGQSMEQFYRQDSKYFFYYLFFGFSYLTDARAREFGHQDTRIYGYTLGLNATVYWLIGGMTLELRYARNYAPKIINLIEAVEHDYYGFSISVSF